uniref:Putative secreted protein n=1 Tax=Ixodes scapularis TaxID=6945 RepID=A0A4D5RCH4_IXOSC
MKLLVFPLAGGLLYFALMVCQSASQDPLFPASCNIRDCSYIMRRMRRLKKILIVGKIKKKGRYCAGLDVGTNIFLYMGTGFYK